MCHDNKQHSFMGQTHSRYNSGSFSEQSSVHSIIRVDQSRQSAYEASASKYSKLGYVKATISFFSGIRQTADPPISVNIYSNGTFFYGSSAPPASTIRGLMIWDINIYLFVCLLILISILNIT